MRVRAVISASLLLLSIASRAAAATFVVSGYVRDASTGEAVIGATVYPSDKSTGCSTNDFGFYSLTLDRREWTIVCSCVGYADLTLTAKPSAGGALRLDFDLTEDSRMLESAKVFSHSKKDDLRLPQMGAQSVDVVTLKKLPTIMGEKDIIRVIQMMPGVQAASEGATGYSVRGGSVDQNLILLDGAPVYDAGHFLGFVSMFNGDVVKNAQLYKGDFPARFGGRTASVLEIGTTDGNMSNFGGEASVGLLTSKICLSGPIAKDKLSFVLAARRSYLDMFFPLFSGIPEGTKLSFYDANAKLTWILNDRNRLYLSAFIGNDRFGMGLEDLGLHGLVMNYSNNSQSLRWSHVFGPRLVSNMILYNAMNPGGIDCEMDECDFTWRRKLRDTGIRYNFTWHANAANKMEFGVEAAYYNLNPSETHPMGESIVQDVVSPTTHAVSPAVYVQNEQKIGDLTLRYGLRFSSFSAIGETEQLYYDPETHERTDSVHFGPGEIIQTYYGLDPRVSASYAFSDDMSVKASYARTHQNIVKTAGAVTVGVTDIWFASSPNIKPEISDQVSVGLNRNILDDAVELSAEGFYRYNRNTRDFCDNPGIVVIEADKEGLLRFGESWAYGLELMARYEFARINGWVGYSWSKAMYRIDGINDGNPYRSPINHEHAVNFVCTWDISRRVSLSGTWLFYSGAPTTFPVARFNYQGTTVPVYSSRNEDSMPDYHRADISLVLRSRKRVEGQRWSGEWDFSVYNLYNRHNAWTISTGYNKEEGRMDARLTYLFPILPSVSYNIKF